jgi:hypothetical protein
VGLDDATFWRDVQEASTPYLALRSEARALRERRDASPDASVQQELKETLNALCSARVDALATARTAVGAERFDRLLYQVIAPRQTMSIIHTPEDDDYEAVVRRRAGGCR